MAFEESSGVPATMLVGPAGMNNGGFGGFGGDWSWILLLVLLCGGGWGGIGGFGGYGAGMMMGDAFGLYPWLNNSQNINDGFRDQMLNTTLTGIQGSVTSGFGDIQTALCGGFAGVNATVNGAQNAISQQLYANQMSDLNRSFATQSSISDLKYTVATENCADRQTISDGIRDLLSATQAQTQAILSQLCNDKLEAKNDLIAQLRSELLYARGQASQDVQTAAIQAGQRALANEIEQYVLPTPKPSYIVANPNCCYNSCGCGSV